MKDSTKKELIAVLVLLIIIVAGLIYYNSVYENYISVNIGQFSFQAPSSIVILISDPSMPANITGKQMYIKNFTVTSSNVNGDETVATGTNLVSQAFSQSVPMSITSADTATIASNTVPQFFTANNLTSITLNGTGVLLIKQ